MKISYLLLFVLFVGIQSEVFAQGPKRIIPQPKSMAHKKGQLQINEPVRIYTNDLSTFETVNYAVKTLSQDLPLNISMSSNEEQTLIRFKLDPKVEGPKGSYELQSSKKGVTISAKDESGLFYGFQTLRQLIYRSEDQFFMDILEISDTPRFQWRAFMLDESRYFKGKEQVLKLLDEMARLKMNVFHWHLVDDQGWRIEIKKYPKLTTIGSKRTSTQVGALKWKSAIQSGVPHEGFYTQEEIKEIVQYAAVRQITVVPEIEMPGHSSAAIAAYPWLGSSGKEFEVPTVFGVSKDVYNVADPKVYQFLTDVLDEVFELFPSKVVHIGGDEVKYDHWKNSAYIQEYMKENNLESPADLQIYFTNRISQYMSSKGRRMMGWNEIMGHNLHEYQDEADTETKEELSKSSVVHFWKGEIELVNQAVSNGFDIVNSLHSRTYLDYPYSSIPLGKAYAFDPIPRDLDPKYHEKVLGLGCQMWGEWIPTPGQMDYMVFPRIAAYAEVGWTQKSQKDFDAFSTALTPLLKIWEKEGIYYAPMDWVDGKKKE